MRHSVFLFFPLYSSQKIKIPTQVALRLLIIFSRYTFPMWVICYIKTFTFPQNSFMNFPHHKTFILECLCIFLCNVLCHITEYYTFASSFFQHFYCSTSTNFVFLNIHQHDFFLQRKSVILIFVENFLRILKSRFSFFL